MHWYRSWRQQLVKLSQDKNGEIRRCAIEALDALEMPLPSPQRSLTSSWDQSTESSPSRRSPDSHKQTGQFSRQDMLSPLSQLSLHRLGFKPACRHLCAADYTDAIFNWM